MPSCRWPSSWSSADTWPSLQSEDTQDKTKKEAKVAEARAAYTEAREAYGKAVEALAAACRSFPSRCPRMTPAARSAMTVEASYLDAMLQQGVCDHELAQTYAADSAERTTIWTRRSSSSRASTRTTASSGPA